jgi:outer membrane receptor protein involved in Fe transport
VIYSIDPATGALLQGRTATGASGMRTVAAPKLAYSIGATLSLPSKIGTFISNVTSTYSGRYFGDAGNRFAEPAYTLVNLSETLKFNDEKTEISLWAKNVTNRFYDVSLNFLAPVGVVGNTGAPRTFGGTVRRRF